MRADLLVARLGTERDTLVLLRAETTASLQTLRTWLEPWLDDSMIDEVADVSPAFAVQLDETATDARGVRGLPHLRYGSEVLARSTSDEVLDALDAVLGGIHERGVNDGRAWVNLRLFTNGTAAMMTDVPRPHLVTDRQLIAAGVRELVNWGVITENEHALVPAPLSQTGTSPLRLRLAGAVLFSDADQGDGERLTALAGRSGHTSWFETSARLIEAGRVRTVSDRPTARHAVEHFLTES